MKNLLWTFYSFIVCLLFSATCFVPWFLFSLFIQCVYILLIHAFFPLYFIYYNILSLHGQIWFICTKFYSLLFISVYTFCSVTREVLHIEIITSLSPFTHKHQDSSFCMSGSTFVAIWQENKLQRKKPTTITRANGSSQSVGIQSGAHRHKPPAAGGGWKPLRSAYLSLGPVSPSGSSPSAPPPGLHSAHCQTCMQTHTQIHTLINTVKTHTSSTITDTLMTRESLKHLKCAELDTTTLHLF